MKCIPLYRNSLLAGWAVVDDTDYAELVKFLWYIDRDGYAVRYLPKPWRNANVTRLYMHRFLTKPPTDMLVDHINGIRTDNRRSNLRPVTRTQNNQNTGRRSHSSSSFKGVRLKAGRWVAEVRCNERGIYLGRYDTPEEAACVYDSVAQQLRGEYARLNF